MSGEVGFIMDGYTTDGYLAEAKGIHPALHFSYRPMDPADRAVALKDLKKAQESHNPKKSELVAGEILSKRVLEWDLLYPQGHPNVGDVVEITPINMTCVQPLLADKLFAIVVMGTMASDEDDSKLGKLKPAEKSKPDQEQAEIDTKN